MVKGEKGEIDIKLVDKGETIACHINGKPEIIENLILAGIVNFLKQAVNKEDREEWYDIFTKNLHELITDDAIMGDITSYNIKNINLK